MLIQIERPGRKGDQQDALPAIWRLGFRPFYLLGAIFAALAVPFWIALVAGVVAAPWGLDAYRWHQHEMVFGFALAIVTGFLFTAVRNWTGLATPRGWRLAGLCALWVAARAAWFAGSLPAALVIETAFLLACAWALLAVLVRARNRRNYFVGALYLVLVAADWAFAGAGHGALGAVTPDHALRFALYLVVVLTLVIGGRVIPGFTANTVRGGLAQWRDPRLDRAAIGFGVAAFAAELLGLAWPAAALAAVASLLHAVRLWGWRPLAARGKPLLWILHLSYAWIAVGFALLAAASLGVVGRSLALHAFTVGTIGGLIIGMITRTALGHTGRVLAVGGREVAMYSLVQAAAALRVVVPLAAPAATLASEVASAVLWSAAFALYAIVYGPWLARPRVDGQPG
jgi:uncharacterized protein involved in response to NO